MSIYYIIHLKPDASPTYLAMPDDGDVVVDFIVKLKRRFPNADMLWIDPRIRPVLHERLTLVEMSAETK